MTARANTAHGNGGRLQVEAAAAPLQFEASAEPLHFQAAAEPLRVLLLHNAYQQRGGEDAVVDSEEALLRAHGHAVLRHQRSNDEIATLSRAALAAQTIWSRRRAQEVSTLIADFRPHVVHLHNSFALLSPSVIWAASQAGVPVVQTLHNFRLLCPQAMLLRDGKVCEDCVGHVPWRAVQHRCYRDSASQSAVLATMLQAHRWLGTYRERVTLYIALNEFCRDRFIAGGLPAERLRVKPNFVDLAHPPAEAPRSGLLFVGRLSSEKGIAVLADAARMLPEGTTLRIVGDGPERHRLEGIVGVELLGALPPARVYEQMQAAAALVLPSICYENFPRTLVEACACGLPVLASRLGALPELVQHARTGLLFDAGDASALAAAMTQATARPTLSREMGRAARAHYEQYWTGAANHRQLTAIYREAIALRPAG